MTEGHHDIIQISLDESNPNIVAIKFDPQVQSDMVLDLVHCYRQVFAEEPWHEWKKCPKCGKKWGIDQINELAEMKFMHCGVLVEDYWPIAGVVEDVNHEIGADASAWLLKDGDQVIGFIWGYMMPLRNLQTKIRVMIHEEVQENHGSHYLVAYLDDMGLSAEYRGRHYAGRLYDLWLNDMKKFGAKLIVTRTQGDPEPTVLYHWFLHKLHYRLLKRYPDSSNVIMTKEI